MTKADDAYTAARAEIARVQKAGETELDLSGEEFRALERLPDEIASLTTLHTLVLFNTQVANITPLAGLTALQVLMLSFTQVADLTPLVSLSALQSLWLEGTQIVDLAPLAGLSALRSLGLKNTLVADITPLTGLTALQTLVLENTELADLTPLVGLTALQFLYLQDTQVADLTPLAGLTGLRSLWLNSTQVADLRPLRDLTELGKEENTGLWFHDTPALRDPELARLSEIKDTQTRTRDIQTRTRDILAYLRTLPPWPAPLPWEVEAAKTAAPTPDPALPLTAEILIEAQDLSGWRFSPTLGAMELFVRDTPMDDRQETLAQLASERTEKLISSLGGRINSGGFRQEVFEEATRFSNILDDASRSLSVRSLELWASLIALGDHLDGNDRAARDGRNALDLLNTEARAALSTFLGIAASLVRSFPEARALDDDHGTFQRRGVTHEMVLDLIEVALRAGFVDNRSASVVQHVAEIAGHDGTQAQKATVVSQFGGKNLILAAALLAAASGGEVAKGAMNDVGADLSDHYGLGGHAIAFLDGGASVIEAFIDSLSPDERARLNAAITDAERKTGPR